MIARTLQPSSASVAAGPSCWALSLLSCSCTSSGHVTASRGLQQDEGDTRVTRFVLQSSAHAERVSHVTERAGP